MAGDLKDFYATCKFAKGITKAAIKEQNDERTAAAERVIVEQIKRDHRYKCFARKVSPVCTKRAADPHELVGRGAGGKITPENTIPVCRACHNAAQGRVGGNRLIFDWVGKADGLAPRADVPGNVWAIWVGQKQRG